MQQQALKQWVGQSVTTKVWREGDVTNRAGVRAGEMVVNAGLAERVHALADGVGVAHELVAQLARQHVAHHHALENQVAAFELGFVLCGRQTVAHGLGHCFFLFSCLGGRQSLLVFFWPLCNPVVSFTNPRFINR